MTSTKIKRFFGDQEREFNLAPQIRKFEAHLNKLGINIGIGDLAARFTMPTPLIRYVEIVEIIRFALIGAGTSANEAGHLINTFVEGEALAANQVLASEIVTAAWIGADPSSEPEPANPERIPVLQPEGETHEPA